MRISPRLALWSVGALLAVACGTLPIVWATAETAASDPSGYDSLRSRHREAEELVLQTPEEALAADAALLADRFGVPHAQAMERLRIEQELPGLMQGWRPLVGARLAGMYIDPGPELRVMVRLTGSEPAGSLSEVMSGAPVPVEFVLGAQLSETDLQRIVSKVDWRRFGSAIQGVYADIMTGEIVLHTYGADLDLAGAAEADIAREGSVKVPIRVEQVASALDTNNRGGRRLTGWLGTYTCTSGFSVKNSAGAKGITTAAHCIDNLYYWWFSGGGPFPMTFQAGVPEPWADIQWHTTTAQDVVPLFHIDETTARTALAQGVGAVGQSVCRWGVVSGGGCTYVASITYKPLGPNVCGLSECNATFSLTAHMSGDYGDSGGPWYSVNTAHGIHLGSVGLQSIYTRVWYLFTLGLSLLLGP